MKREIYVSEYLWKKRRKRSKEEKCENEEAEMENVEGKWKEEMKKIYQSKWREEKKMYDNEEEKSNNPKEMSKKWLNKEMKRKKI